MRNYTKLSVIAVAVLMMGAISIVAEEENILTREQIGEQQTIDEEVTKIQEALDREAREAEREENEEVESNVFPERDMTVMSDDEIQPDGGETAGKVWYGEFAGIDGNNFVHIGGYAGRGSQSTAWHNTFIGYGSAGKGTGDITGSGNSFFGAISGHDLTTGSSNTCIGTNSGYKNTSGNDNTFIGDTSGYTNTVGYRNTYVGKGAGYYAEGYGNTMLGANAGYHTTSGQENVYIGDSAGYKNETGCNNIFIGETAGYHEMGNNKLYIDSRNTSIPLIYGEFDNNLLRVNGSFETSLAEESTANNKNIVALDRNNTGTGGSDVGFSLENVADDYKWTFRTYNPSEGFAASKIGTGGTEFEVGNTGTSLASTVVKMGGVVVFKNGHLVNKSGNEITSLIDEQSKKLAKMGAALKAKDEKIALLEKRQKAQDFKIVQLETMKDKIVLLESLLTNIALDTSNDKKEKVSLNK